MAHRTPASKSAFYGPFECEFTSAGRNTAAQRSDTMTMSHDPTAPPGGSPGAELDTARSSGSARVQIRDVKDQVVDQAKTSFRQARDSASSSLNDSRHQAADRIGGIASAVRSTSEHLRSENQAGVADLTDSLAEQVERLSSYLRERNLRAVRDDVETFARRQPAVAIGVALGLGMLGARFFKSSGRTSGFEGKRLPPGQAYASGQSGRGSQPAGGGYGAA
jgi:ElaB/YqjD/DUF883 family membrane-anchored ribosome-binding protein